MHFLQKVSLGALSAILFVSLFPIARGDIDAAEQRKEDELRRIEREFELYRDSLGDMFSQDSGKQEQRMERIMQRIEEELVEFDTQKEQNTKTENDLREARRKITTLNGQVQIMEAALASSQKELEVVKIQILKRVADLQYLMEEAERLKAEKEVQQKEVLAFFALLQRENEEFGVSDDARNIMRLILSDETFSENLWQEEQLTALESVGRQIFHDIEAAEGEIEKVVRLVNEENIRLNELLTRKDIEHKRIEEQTAAKKALLASVQDSEAEYQKLLDESKQQMYETAMQISALLEDRESVDQTMRLLEEEYQRQARQQLVNDDQDDAFAVGERFLAEDAAQKPFAWPITPKKGISAYYHDKEYEDVFHVTHQAIDIPAPQGTEILAPALGYVYKVTDNGMGYSSLILAHRDNLMTVYGHVSEFLVEEGQLVAEGTPIALSGGTPGTIGAGWMTTGPHLHFEVFKNGSHVNPLEYLPLDELPPDTTIPEQYAP